MFLSEIRGSEVYGFYRSNSGNMYTFIATPASSSSEISRTLSSLTELREWHAGIPITCPSSIKTNMAAYVWRNVWRRACQDHTRIWKMRPSGIWKGEALNTVISCLLCMTQGYLKERFLPHLRDKLQINVFRSSHVITVEIIHRERSMKLLLSQRKEWHVYVTNNDILFLSQPATYDKYSNILIWKNNEAETSCQKS